jgi:hypothetical protein
MLAVVGNHGPWSPTLERRGSASRQRLVMRVAKLICSGGEYPCVIRDVSESGIKLRLFHGHPPDTCVLIELSNGELYAAERRWTKDDIAGFRFTSDVDVDDFVNEQHAHGRRPVRLRTQHGIQFVAAGDRGNAVMVNLSARGACSEAGRLLPVGSPLRIELAGWPTRFASVSWRNEFRHGLAFQDEMTLAEFARLASDLQPFQTAAAAWREVSAVEQRQPRRA